MKYTTTAITLASLATAALAQAQDQNVTDYANGAVSAMQSVNLTLLPQALQLYPDVVAALANGGNFTVFAPSDSAITTYIGEGNDLSSINATAFLDVLQYHVLPGYYPQSALSTGANHTIVPTLLQAPLLGNNATAPSVISFGMDGDPRVRTATQNVTVGANATYANLLLHIVDQVIMPPMNLTATVGAANLTSLADALTTVDPTLPATLGNTPRLTVFAPTNAAFANISDILPQLNTSQILNVLANHLINGTVVYSTQVTPNLTAVSAAGEELSFSVMNGSVYVMSGDAMSRILVTDIPIDNGVVHIIESVLTNTESDPAAAASAASSAAEVASTSMPATTAMGGANAAPTSSTGTGAASRGAFIAGSTVTSALIGVVAFMLVM